MTSSSAPASRVRQPARSRADASWATLYRWGGAAGMLFVVLVVIPLVLLATAPVPPAEAGPLLDYVAHHKVVYLTQLICFVGLSVPALVVFTSVGMALRTVDKSTAVIGALLGVGSEIVALSVGSSPQSLHPGLVGLSDSYASAATDSERAGLADAAEALIAATNAVSWAGILTAAGILVLSALMGRSDFGRALAVVGVVTGAVGIVSEALRPMIGPAYLLYGLLLPVWFALVARALLRLGRRSASA